MKIYINGVLIDTLNSSYNGTMYALGSPSDCVGGTHSDPTAVGTFDGQLDQIEIYNKELNITEVGNLNSQTLV